MNPFKYDITFCPNKTCPLRPNCERNSDRLEGYHHPVSMAGFAPDNNGQCDYYVPLNDEEEEPK